MLYNVYLTDINIFTSESRIFVLSSIIVACDSENLKHWLDLTLIRFEAQN